MNAPARPRWQSVQAIACAAVVGWTLAYALCDWGGWHRLTYDPYLARWTWTSGPTPRVPINYLGGLLWGLGGAVVGASVAALGLRLWRRPLPPTVLGLAAAWALTGVALAGTYYMWTIWPFS
ncbi:MAG TPA: hypothetical protein VHE35_10315 [Kofleriaceae bacterium]|nr:hypothetical protein [Kofleriaceae bacterium]